ncbi:hypothetical protein QZH41_004870 [Actinostola sp. cb2023]|nr:hypothetical protein QZH41_004870 [Actinostola sp. cb2023]
MTVVLMWTPDCGLLDVTWCSYLGGGSLDDDCVDVDCGLLDVTWCSYLGGGSLDDGCVDVDCEISLPTPETNEELKTP